MSLEHKKEKIIVLDANVLISLMEQNRFDILKELVKRHNYKFIIPLEVKNEIHYRHQRKQISTALKEKWLEKQEINDISEIDLYAQYRHRFGNGESACMAISIKRKLILASDEKAVIKEISTKIGQNYIIGTKDILLIAKKLIPISDI